MKDKLGREAEYLRLSLTDKCNLRCIYCMPEKDEPFLKEDILLTNEEIILIVKLMAQIGIRKVRLTGGEPLVRENIITLIKEINEIPGIEEVYLTTNGLLFGGKEAEYKASGLKGVNISLDSLDENKYKELTRGGDLKKLIASIEKLLSQGMKVKINSVIIDGKNSDEIIALAELTFKYNLDVRFIELMPVGCASSLKAVSNDIVKDIIKERYLFNDAAYEEMKGPAQYIKLPNALGRVGFISPISDNFCESCNRIRVTSDGFLKQCLHWNYGVDLKEPLRSGMSESKLLELIEFNIYNKPNRHSFEVIKDGKDNRNMNQIGG